MHGYVKNMDGDLSWEASRTPCPAVESSLSPERNTHLDHENTEDNSNILSTKVARGFHSSALVTHQIFCLPLNDPVTALYADIRGIGIGTIFGRVLTYVFPKEMTTHAAMHHSDPCRSVLGGTIFLYQAFSDDAIRAIYADESRVCAVVGNQVAVEWPSDSLGSRGVDAMFTTKFDRRISSQLKYVLQHDNEILVPSTGITMVYDILTRTRWLCSLRIPDQDVVPMSFRREHLISYFHSVDDSTPSLKVFKLALSRQEPQWGSTVECIFHQDLPSSVTGVSKATFWGEDRLVFVANGRHIYVFHITTGKRLHHWTGHSRDICILCADDPDVLVTISENSEIRIWNNESLVGPAYAGVVQPSRFTLGNVYHARVVRHTLIFSCDEELACVQLPDVCWPWPQVV